MENLNDKPTAIIRKASSIRNFEFNLIRHPANFITYLTGLLIQFMLLLFQITAPGPTSAGNPLDDAFGNAVAPSHTPPTLSSLSWDGAIYHVLGFIPPSFHLHAEELKEEKRTKQPKHKTPDLSLLMLVHVSQSSCLLHSCQIFLLHLRNSQK